MTMPEHDDDFFGGHRYGRAFPVQVPGNGAATILITEEVLLVGWSIRETTGAASAVFQLFSGTTTGGLQVAEIGLGPGLDSTPPIPYGGINCYNGLMINPVSGTVRGAVWVRTRTD